MIQQLLQISHKQPLTSHQNTKDWSTAYFQLTKDKSPIEKAILGGFASQQFSFTFMAGYQAALDKMFPNIATDQLRALCVSEVKGGHPKFIETTLIDHQINGLKTYVTAGSEAAHLFVLCKTKEIINGKPLLKIVHLPQSANNIEITNFDLPFMLETKHGKVAFKNTKITPDQILKGDGFVDYTKPFRTFEDIFVGLSYNAMLLRQAIDNQWNDGLKNQLLFNIYTLKNLITLPPSDKETHLLLSAYEANFKQLLPIIESNIEEHSLPEFREDWKRNKKVLSLSEKLKKIRLFKAREVIFGEI